MSEGTTKPSSADKQAGQPSSASERTKLATLLAETVAERDILKTVIAAMPDTGFTIRDRDYRLTYQSELTARLYGNRLGEKCYSVFEGREDVCEGCPAALAFEDGQSHTSVREVVMPSGDIAFWENVANPICDADGNIVSCLEINTNITQHKRADDELRRSERKYRSLIENIPSVTWTTDCEGKTVFISPNVKDVYGFTSEEVCRGDESIRMKRIHPEDVERVKKGFAGLFEKGGMFDLEYRIKRKDGKWIWLHDRATATYVEDNVLYADGVFMDITQRKGAEREVAEAAVFLEAIGDALLALDAQRKVCGVNRASMKLWGYDTKDGMLGLGLSDIFPERTLSSHYAQMKKAVDTDTSSIFECVALTRDGNEIPVMVTGTVMKDAEGKVLRFAGVLRDITERKRLEQALANVTEEERERLRRDLHDGISQQLTGLRFLAESLRRELSATHPETADHVAKIEQIAGDALTSVWQIAKGLEPLSKEPDGLVEALRELARRTNNLYGIDFQFTSGKPVLIQNPDMATHLFLIAQEAVSNAVKHAKPGRIAISLSERNGTVRLAVEDDGVGFSRKKQSKGMGMDIMRSRAAIIGASFDVQSGRAGGTVVTCSWKRPPNTTG